MNKKTTTKEQSRHAELSKHLNMDLVDIEKIFSDHEVTGYMLTVTYTKNKGLDTEDDRFLFGFAGNVNTVLNSVSEGITTVIEPAIKSSRNPGDRLH